MKRQTKCVNLLCFNLFIVLVMCLIYVKTGFAKDTGIIFGIITDAHSGVALSGVNLVIVGTDYSATTDKNGKYRFKNIPVGEYEIKINKTGYRPQILPVKVRKGKKTRLNASLTDITTLLLPEVVVSAERLAEKSSVSDHIISDRKQLLLREGHMQDPIRLISTLPGISTLGDLFSSAKLYVRGGDPSENLFMVDWVTLHWPWYWGGMKSILNSEVIEKIELFTGGFPAKYGGYLSSVLNVTTREGNRERFCGNASFGFINTQALFEGPITKKGSFLFAVRRTYLDLVMGKEAKFPVPNFLDFNLKLGYDITNKHRIFFSGFSGSERVDFYTPDPEPGRPGRIYDKSRWNTQSIQLKSQLSENAYSVFALTREKLDFHVEIGKTTKMDIDTCDYRMIGDFTLKVHPNHELKTGFKITDVNFNFEGKVPHPKVPHVDPNDPDTKLLSILAKIKTNTAGIYLQDTWTLTDKFSLTGGVRSDYLAYNKELTADARLALKYDLDDATSLRAAVGNYTQLPELEALSKNPRLVSKKAIHYICGISRRFSENLRGWCEVYYKDYRDLVVVDTVGNYSNTGKGYARGIEFFLERRFGDINGWISYSLSESKRRDSPEAKEYYSDFDQPHMLSIVLDWNILKNLVANLQFRFASGRPYTPVISAYRDHAGVWRPVWGEKNSARYEPFHQLNLRITYKFKIGKLNAESYFEVWNLYNRKNIMGYIYRYGEEYENNVKRIPYYSTPFIPGGGFRIEF